MYDEIPLPDRKLFGITMRWIFFGVGVLVVLSILLGSIGWVLGWFAVPAQITSPQNVRAQWQWAYNTEEDLKASARNYCAAAVAYEQTTNEFYKEQRYSQVLVQEQNYNRIASDYNARLRNAFEAGLVAPPDVMPRAGALSETVNRLQVNETLVCPGIATE